MDWARKIRELRFLENLKQDALAQQLGVSQASISQWERDVAVPPAHIRAKLRRRMLVSPGERLRSALRTSVVHSPNLCGLLAVREGEVVIELLSHAGYAMFPLLTPADLGQRLKGKLGPEVDSVVDRLIDEGAFEGRVSCATIASTAMRNGHSIGGIVTYTPFCHDVNSCIIRAEARLMGPDERCPEIEQVNHLSLEDAAV